jgi:hypothetical protein
MKITNVKLYTIRADNTGERGAAAGEAQYWRGLAGQHVDPHPTAGWTM